MARHDKKLTVTIGMSVCFVANKHIIQKLNLITLRQCVSPQTERTTLAQHARNPNVSSHVYNPLTLILIGVF